MNWLKIPFDKMQAAPRIDARNLSKAVVCSVHDLQRMACMDEKNLTATRTIVAWDIETVSQFEEDEDSFPRAWRPGSHVINIGLRIEKVIGTSDDVTRPDEGDDSRKLISRKVLVLGKTATSSKCEIEVFDNEVEMMLVFLHKYVNSCDTIFDYNGKSFDWTFVFTRLLLFRMFSKYKGRLGDLEADFQRARCVRLAYSKLLRSLAEINASGNGTEEDLRAIIREGQEVTRNEGVSWDSVLRTFKTTGKDVDWHYDPRNVRGCPGSQFTNGNGDFLVLEKLTSYLWFVVFGILMLGFSLVWTLALLAGGLACGCFCCCGCGRFFQENFTQFNSDVVIACFVGPPAALSYFVITVLWLGLAVLWLIGLAILLVLASPVWMTLVLLRKFTLIDVVRLNCFCFTYIWNSLAVQIIVNWIRGEEM